MREELWPPGVSAIPNMSAETRSTAPSDALDCGLWASSGMDMTMHRLPDPSDPERLHSVRYYDYASHLLPFTECPACCAEIRAHKIALLTTSHFVYPCEDCDQFVWVEVITNDYE